MQLAARNGEVTREVLLAAAPSTAMEPGVRVVSVPRPHLLQQVPARGEYKVPLGCDLDNSEYESSTSGSQQQHPMLARELQSKIMPSIADLRYFAGNIEMSVHLGRLCLNSYQETQSGVFMLEEFERVISNERFEANVTEE